MSLLLSDKYVLVPSYWGDAVALVVGHWTCDSQVAGSSPARAPPRSGLGQATYIYVPVTKQYNLVPAKRQ